MRLVSSNPSKPLSRRQIRERLGLGDVEFKNGRFVKVGRFTYEDRLAARLGITTSMMIKRRFAWFPVETIEGRLWLRSYWSFYVEQWGSGLHAGRYPKLMFRTAVVETLKARITRILDED